MKKTSFQLTDVLLKDIIPKLAGGALNGKGTILNNQECENLVQVLSISISIEPFMEMVANLPQKTLMARQKERYDESEPDTGK